MIVSPAQAVAWLDSNTHNRPLSDSVVIKYQKDMAAGRWKYNHLAILFDTTGKLLDGQHRLWACVESGVSFDTDVVFGAEPDVQDTLDDPFIRSAGHQGALGGAKNATNAAAIAKLILTYRERGTMVSMNNPKNSPTKSQIIELVKSGDAQLEDAASRVCQLSKALCRASIVGFCYYLFSLQNTVLAGRFFGELQSGVGLSRGNPALLLREKLRVNAAAKAKLPALHLIALFFRAWSSYRDGRDLKILKTWRCDGPNPEAFPTI